MDQEMLSLMFYNVENAFDTFDDPLTNDEDFLPGGLMRWNLSRYRMKISSLYKTIVAAGDWTPPDVVAFCEVENRKVLEELVYGTYLSKFNYGIIHEESPDKRGIDVCLIYRRDKVDIESFDYWLPAGANRDEFGSRSVLCAKMIAGTDTIHLIMNHWPSRKGGVLAAGKLRGQIALMVQEKADSIETKDGGRANIIIAGDFNCTPAGQEILLLDNFVNLFEKEALKGLGTYRYKGVWEMIDQVLVSKKLATRESGLHVEKQGIFMADFLMTGDPVYPGLSPFSTYRGYRYQGGFSDHLPLLLQLHSPD